MHAIVRPRCERPTAIGTGIGLGLGLGAPVALNTIAQPGDNASELEQGFARIVAVSVGLLTTMGTTFVGFLIGRASGAERAYILTPCQIEECR